MSIALGHEMKSQFSFNTGWRNMNHGSFGAVPRAVQDALQDTQKLLESAPDVFIRYEYSKRLIESRRAVAKFVYAPLQTVVLVPNATSGIDTIVRNLKYAPMDYILMFDTAYGACKRTALHLMETIGVKLCSIPLVHPVSDADILSTFVRTVAQIRQRGEDVKVAIFDVISFQPGVRMPFERLVTACQELNILSCVDGAHSVGQIPLNLLDLDPDFFVGNLHKWLYVPRGCAMLYTPLRNQQLLRTTFPTSWGFSPKYATCIDYFTQSEACQSPFETLFESLGTMDYSPFLCIPAALSFRERICGGEGEIQDYNSKLASRGGELIAQILGTMVLDNAERTLTRGCSMVNVRLPVDIRMLDSGCAISIERMAKMLMKDYNTFVPIFEHGGFLWARVSAQIYLELEDFTFLSHALKRICYQVVGSGEDDSGVSNILVRTVEGSCI